MSPPHRDILRRSQADPPCQAHPRIPFRSRLPKLGEKSLHLSKTALPLLTTLTWLHADNMLTLGF